VKEALFGINDNEMTRDVWISKIFVHYSAVCRQSACKIAIQKRDNKQIADS